MKIGIRILLTFSLIIFTTSFGHSQKIDSTLTHNLSPVTIKAYRFQSNEVKQLESVHQTYITSGKKHEVILVQDLPANIAEKTGRQIFAKISGAFIYDMDGSGNQVNVSTRGLDPHRSWEYNIRQNGIMTNSDIYGYPASHYSPPMEAINKIEIIRGSASLQYGSQFGGMINYITRHPDTTKKIGFESLNSIGSFGLQSTYNAIGGKIGKLSYYAYYQRRISTGYRKNARSEADAQFVSLEYAINPSMNLRAELGRSQYLYQIPGALTDDMFYANPKQSTRSRNYFNPDIYIPSFNFTWQITNNTKLNCIGSAVLGTRKSVQFIGFADTKDTIDSLTGEYKPRQVDIDNFNSYTFEARLQHDYKVFNGKHTLISGIRYINNDLHRRQQGKGTTGTDYDLTITSDQFGRDLHMKTKNIAFFAENLFRITKRLELSLGFRFESGLSAVDGVISYLPNEKVPQDISHKFPLFGISGQYRLNHSNKLYAGWSQAYRPVIFADLIPATPLDQTDPDLKDAFGHNFEMGLKGELFNRLTYDLTFFQIIYKNRIGSLVLNDANGQSYVWKTNFGDSKTQGIELYAEYKIKETMKYRISVFAATSYFDGMYMRGTMKNGAVNTDITHNRLETVPKWIHRSGLQIGYKEISAILQYNYVAESYSDALNTKTPSANGASGIVPSYHIFDVNLAYRFNNNLNFKFGINNLTNEQYFTKRPAGYPGQGVWSSDGRGFVASIGIKI